MQKGLARTMCILVWLGASISMLGCAGLTGERGPKAGKDSPEWQPGQKQSFYGVACRIGDRTYCGFNDTGERTEVDCSDYAGDPERQAVLFAFGQSNSSNTGSDRYTPVHNVANFNPHDGRCYKAKDPLLGADGDGGSVWGWLGDALIEQGHYDSVLVITIGIGGTSIARWAPGGDLHVRVEHTANLIVRQGLTPTHVLWHQGESDAKNTSADEYIASFTALLKALRSYGIDAPVYPAVATICANTGSDAIRAAQRALPTLLPGVYPGADTDTLVESRYRHDSCHFSKRGMQAHAELWLEAISANPAEP